MPRAELKLKAKSQIAGKWPGILLFLIVIALVPTLFALVPFVGWIASVLFVGALMITNARGLLRFVDNGTKPDPIEAVKKAFSEENFLRGLLGYLRFSVFTFLWSLLLVIPGVIKAISYSQMFYLMADNPEMTAAEAQAKSMELMNGHKAEYFVLQLSFIGWMILATLTLGILYIWLLPYMQTTYANYYRTLVSK